MTPYKDLSREELLKEKENLEQQFAEIKAKGLKLDMSRGKPSTAQLNLSMGMMDVLDSNADLVCEEGVDCRNYGVLDGIKEAKELLADMTEVSPDNIIIYGNSSLNVMYDTVARSMTHGVMGSTPSIHFCAGRRSKDPVRRGGIPGRKRGYVLPGDGPAAHLP